MFPGIAHMENQYTQTLLAEWSLQAELQRKEIEQNTIDEVEWVLIATVNHETGEFIRSESIWE